jgi:hypothetical protein
MISAGIYIKKNENSHDDFGYYQIEKIPSVGEEITLNREKYKVVSVEEFEKNNSQEAQVKIHVKIDE